jgi:hypothetical protein
MNIAEEKEYLYQVMKLMLEERRLISDELLEIRKRINKLNDFQELGINDIPAIDYISLRQSVSEKKYETVKTATKNVHDAFKKTMEFATPKIFREKNEEEEKKDIIIEESQNKKEEKDIWKDISLEKEENSPPVLLKSNSTKKKKPSFERMNTVIVNLLKDCGTPLDTKTIRIHVEESLDYIFSGNAFSMLMWQVKKENDKINQPARGFYQYTR